MPDILIIGHRGASAYELENSFSSFETALKMGAGIIEMDVHLSIDGEVIVIHDEKINRTTNEKGQISKMTLEKIKTLKLKNGQEIPTLREVLERFKGQCQFLVEIKDKGAALSSYDIAKELDMLDDIVFSSFYGPWLLNLKSKDKRVRIGFITKDKKQNNVQIASSLKAEAILFDKNIATRDIIDEAKTEELDVYIWTLDKSKIMKKFIEMGVDGIITNKPDILVKTVNEL